MFGKTLRLPALAAALMSGLIVAPAPATAQPFGYGGRSDLYYPVQGRGDRRGDRQGRRWEGSRDNDGRGYDRRGYDRRDYGSRGRCRDKGTGGTILGAIAGGLLGNTVVGRRGDGTAGAVVGAGVGALAGRAIDRDC